MQHTFCEVVNKSNKMLSIQEDRATAIYFTFPNFNYQHNRNII